MGRSAPRHRGPLAAVTSSRPGTEERPGPGRSPPQAPRAGEVALERRALAHRALAPPAVERHQPCSYQREALEAWLANHRRGVVVLPTGSGKPFLAVMAIDRCRRSALVVVPTLDLMNQWYDLLLASFDCSIGLVGGGYHEPAELTVATYDSAQLHMDRLGNRFGVVIFDECHHLPSPGYALAAQACLAPFRLGLTATPERADGGEGLYAELVGPVVYRKDIDELSGSYLASYRAERVMVSLTEEERREYDQERGIYLSFLRAQGIRMSSPRGWSEFVMHSARGEPGRRAMRAYRRQRQLALTASRKLAQLERLLHAHRRDRVIIFTEDNATVYAISDRLLVPAITHQTKSTARHAILAALNAGSLGAVVTSTGLNDGGNVQAAHLAIVLSGSGWGREHVQRLGRVLRKRGDKQAVLYELVSAGTAEERTSAKRREHRAYQ